MSDDRYLYISQALAIYRDIRRRRRTIEELSAALEIHPQTVRRLIEALRASGIDVTATRRQGEGSGQPPYEYRAGKRTTRRL